MERAVWQTVYTGIVVPLSFPINTDFFSLNFSEYGESATLKRVKDYFAIGQVVCITIVRLLGPPMPLSPWIILLAMVGAAEWGKLVRNLAFVNALDPLSAATLAPLLALTHLDLLEQDDPLQYLFNDEMEVRNLLVVVICTLTGSQFERLRKSREAGWHNGVVTRCVSQFLLGGTTALELWGGPEFCAFRAGLLSSFSDDLPEANLLSVSWHNFSVACY